MHAIAVLRSSASHDLEGFVTSSFKDFPWRIDVRDWENARYTVGKCQPHWRGDALTVEVKTLSAGRDILGLRAMEILEDFVRGEIDMRGNLYLLTWLRLYANLELGVLATAAQVIKNRAYRFQSIERAKINVSSHYDLSEEFFDAYLDRVYRSYSCGIFEKPEDLKVPELLKVGQGKGDDFDSLEKAQYAKFADAAAFVDPKPAETILDIGCGYGGQLRVGAEMFPKATWIGWTHSATQIKVGRELLRQAGVGSGNQTTMLHGDYREDVGVYDHALSTGMACHVGPHGLVPYVQQVRKRLRKDGRYMHHVIMNPYSRRPLDSYVGVAFNKKYVWPGFHWFSVGVHYEALERNGFRILGEKNLSKHYAKTAAAWYERMMADEDRLRRLVGDQTFRAFQIYLTGCSAGFSSDQIEIHRVYCEAR